MMGCRTKKLVGSLFKITVGALNNSRGFRWKALFVLGTCHRRLCANLFAFAGSGGYNID